MRRLGEDATRWRCWLKGGGIRIGIIATKYPVNMQFVIEFGMRFSVLNRHTGLIGDQQNVADKTVYPYRPKTAGPGHIHQISSP